MRRLIVAFVACAAATITCPAQETPAPVAPAQVAAPDAAAMAAKAIEFLRSRQDHATGGWNVNPKGPTFPAITALVLQGLLMEPGVADADPAVAAGVLFLLDKQQPDGGIYDKILPSYNTAISLSGLAKLHAPDERTRKAIASAQTFLKGLQYGEGAVVTGEEGSAQTVTRDHPFYGGWGYGSHGRPDLSNTAFAIEGLRESGLDEKDPAFQRALVFLQRCQMQEKGPDGSVINPMPYAKGSHQGGFIYSTSENKDKVGVGQSQTAFEIEETLTDGTNANRLRAYGSMTYSGFKSYLYAGLTRDDPRVRAALGWIATHYELRWNAGMPTQAEGGKPGQATDGMYYYYLVFAKALAASGSPTVEVVAPDGQRGARRWAADLTARLAELQQPDGSFRSVDDRWMENDPVLITAYSLIALQHARRGVN